MMTNLDEKLQKKIENAYMEDPTQDPEKFIDQFIENSNKKKKKKYASLKEDMIKYCDSLCKQEKGSKKPLLIAITIGIIATLFGIISASGSDSEKSIPDNKPPVSREEHKESERIYTSELEDLISDKEITYKVSQDLMRDFKDYKERIIKEVKGRDFVETVGSDVDLGYYKKILESVKKEFKYLGLGNNYEIRILKNKAELKVKENGTRLIWLVKRVGTYVSRIKFELIGYDGKKASGDYNFTRLQTGEAKLDCVVENNDIYAKSGNIYVTAETRDKEDNHITIYCEALHNQIIDAKLKLLKKIVRIEAAGDKVYYHGLSEGLEASKLVDEAIVHGLSHSWIEENLEKFGLAPEDLMRDVEEKESMFYYKGARIIRKLAKEIGRKELLEDYMQDPLKYWDILKTQVLEYRNIMPE